VISTHAFPSSGSPAAAVSDELACGDGEAADELGLDAAGVGMVGLVVEHPDTAKAVDIIATTIHRYIQTSQIITQRARPSGAEPS
jgi:hypothetical protein